VRTRPFYSAISASRCAVAMTECAAAIHPLLLREGSVLRATQSMTDTSEIYRSNLQTMQSLGLDGWQALTRTIHE